MQKAVSKISYLDGIRGVAAFLVFFHHFLLAFYTAFYTWDVKAVHLRNNFEISYGQSLLSVFSNGNFCVCIFFVLSGFVLSKKYFDTHSTGVLISGAQRRFIRLYIPVATTVILSFILYRSFHYYNIPARIIAHSEWWFGPNLEYRDSPAAFLRSLTYSAILRGDTTFDTSLWTMGIEFYGSLFVFAFLALTHNTKNRRTALLLVLAYCFFTDGPYLGAFVLGISLNYTLRLREKLNKYAITFLAIILLMVSLVFGAYPTSGDIRGTFFSNIPVFILPYAGWIHIVGGYFLVLAFVFSIPLQRFISMRLFRFLGYISFSFYLLHPLVLSSLSSYLLLQFNGRFGYNKSMVVIFILTTAVCLAASWLMTKYVDVPGMKFAKYVYNRFIKKNPERQPEISILKAQDAD